MCLNKRVIMMDFYQQKDIRNKPLSDYLFRSEDNTFEVLVKKRIIKKINKTCLSAGYLETGGIFLGYYTDDSKRAVVTKVSRPSEDSTATRFTFIRGVVRLQSLIDKFWVIRKEYYLGEWHFHPFSEPTPSPLDNKHMFGISKSENYHTPEPILIIIGGNPQKEWKLKMYIFPRAKNRLELKKTPDIQKIRGRAKHG